MSQEAFEKWVTQFDTESNEYIDKGADEFFTAGFDARQPEIDALKVEIDSLKFTAGGFVKDWMGRLHDVSKLQAENERLRAAAKALGDFVKMDVRWNDERDRLLTELDAELEKAK